ncbi:hypothetical protein KV580_14865 [Pseudomonas chlororaphis]|nr:hypothetical protein [Pseudomonas chlororaphis]
MDTVNPLLQESLALPNCSSVRVEQLIPAFNTIIQGNLCELGKIANGADIDVDWDSFFKKIALPHACLSRLHGIVMVLGSARPSKEWGYALKQCRELYANYLLVLRRHRGLFEGYQGLASKETVASSKAMLESILCDFRLAGTHLDQPTKVQELEMHIRELESRFLANVSVANHWANRDLESSNLDVLEGLADEDRARIKSYYLSELADWNVSCDIPAPFSAVVVDAVFTGSGRCRINWDDPQTVNALLTDAKSGVVRSRVYQASVTRASSGFYGNGFVLDRLLTARAEKARLLGFANSAELQLQGLSLTSTHQVRRFLASWTARQKPGWIREAQELRKFALHEGLPDLQPWDYAFYAKRLCGQLAGIGEDELSAYFELEQALQGLLGLASHLFGLEFIARKELDTWDKSVRPYEVRENGITLGYLYIDLFARDEKTGDLGVAFPANRHLLSFTGLRGLELPIAVLSCWLSPSLPGQPLLLKHEQTRTLFREFGRCLQQLLNRDEHGGLLGINYAWEAGEFSAALMEQWCCSRDFLVQVGRHHQTGEPLSHRQADGLMILLSSQKGLQEARTLMLASLALELHQGLSAPGHTAEQHYPGAVDPGYAIRQCAARVGEQVLVLAEPEIDSLAFSLNDLVTGAGAAYFVYPWSQALAQTVFARFEDRGLFNHEEGKRLREGVFAPSASRPVLASVEAFLGRKLDELTAPVPN